VAHAIEIAFAEDHPTRAGHFPGNPIIPGALLLDTVLLAVTGEVGSPSCVIRSVKFLRPVRPGDRIRIEWDRAGAEIHFECALVATSEIAVSGTIRLGDKL